MVGCEEVDFGEAREVEREEDGAVAIGSFVQGGYCGVGVGS